MKKNSVLFYIAREAGLEFVFTSGHALKYPLHTHVSTYTVTVVRRGVVRLFDGRTVNVHPAGSTYVVAPHQPHSPAYSDNFDIVSLCVGKTHVSNTKRADMLGLFIRHGRHFVQAGLLSGEDVQAIGGGIERIYSGPADFLPPGGFSPQDLLSRPRASLSDWQFIRRFKRETGLTPHQYIIQDRIREAKKTLASRLPIVQAAGLAGFYDQSHLNRWFNRSIGITPNEYVKSCFLSPPRKAEGSSKSPRLR